MEQYPELQEDLSLEDTNESLNQLKLASLDDKNWPPDEVPVFPKSGEGVCCASTKWWGMRKGESLYFWRYPYPTTLAFLVQIIAYMP